MGLWSVSVRHVMGTQEPRKAELEEAVRIDTTPDELAAAVLQPVKVVEDAAA